VLWGDRLAWIGAATASTHATIGHKGVRRSPRPGGGGALLYELGLLGKPLAISLNDGGTRATRRSGCRSSTARGATWCARLPSGEADRSYVGVSFDAGALYFAQICSGTRPVAPSTASPTATGPGA